MSDHERETGPARRSRARERLLEKASEVFYAEGVHAVGVDRLIAEAGVTKATFYRHFPAKEDLVLAYLRGRDAEIRSRAEGALRTSARPREALAALVAGLADEVCATGFRGCPFINAAAEYPDPHHPVRRAVADHREWFRDALVSLMRAEGHPAPDRAAATLVLLRDGAMVGGYLDGDAVRDTLTHAVAALLGPAAARDTGPGGERHDGREGETPAATGGADRRSA